MDSRPCPAIPCTLCSKPLDLQKDLYADENGKAVHEDCYVKRLISARDSVSRSRNSEM
jgi:hypothetical protein